MTPIGYTVIEWNQASHMPRVLVDDPTDSLAEAREWAAKSEAANRAVGRRETYTVVELTEVENE